MTDKILPEDWVWKRLGDLCDLQNGFAFKSSDYVESSNTMNFRMSQIRPNGGVDLDNNPKYLPDNFVIKYKEFLLNEGDIVIAMTDMATETKILGVPTVIPFDKKYLLLNQRVGRLFNFDYKIVNVPFLSYILKSQQINQYYKELGRGGLQINIGKQDILNATIPIPPLSEQQRIAARLDALMGQLEKAKSALAAFPEMIKSFRQAVLAQAVSGRLTEDRPGEEMNWEEKRIGDVLIDLTAGKSFKCEERPPVDDEIGVLKVSAVSWGNFNEEESKTCVDEDKINMNYLVNVGDFLMSRANTIELVGAVVIVKEIAKKLMLSDKTLRLKFSDNVNPFWILYFLRSRDGRNQIEEFSTGAQLSMRNISQDSIKKIQIPLPPLPEQEEIVRRVERLFAYADSLEQQYAQLKEKLELLPQAILAKAFRGEI